jgi:biopolymer transport protein TolR
VNKEGLVFIGESEVAQDNLINLLRAMTEGNEERRIYIRSDHTISYGTVMRIIGDVNGAGFRKVALISQAK